jgi:hypothetical protein
VHGSGWWVLDHIIGPSTPVSFDAFWHLHPGWQITTISPHVGRLTQGQETVALASSAPLTFLAPGESPLAAYSPDYGIVEPAPIAQASIEITPPATIATFIPAPSAITSGLCIESVPIERPAAGWRNTAFRVHWNGAVMFLLAALEPNGIAADESSAPFTRWGTAEVQTDARVALLIDDGHGWSEALMVNGAALHTGRHTLVSLPHHSPMVRLTQLAPAVHGV